MIIRFTSTMTADDELRAASALTVALKHLLAPFPIAYAIHIETTSGAIVDDAGDGTPTGWLPDSGRPDVDRREPWAAANSSHGFAEEQDCRTKAAGSAHAPWPAGPTFTTSRIPRV